MSVHHWETMFPEVAQKIPHSDRISKTELQFDSLRQK
jgi:hypothetical protein